MKRPPRESLGVSVALNDMLTNVVVDLAVQLAQLRGETMTFLVKQGADTV